MDGPRTGSELRDEADDPQPGVRSTDLWGVLATTTVLPLLGILPLYTRQYRILPVLGALAFLLGHHRRLPPVARGLRRQRRRQLVRDATDGQQLQSVLTAPVLPPRYRLGSPRWAEPLEPPE